MSKKAQEETPFSYYVVTVPQNTIWQPQEAMAFIATLAGTTPASELNIIATSDAITWVIGDLFHKLSEEKLRQLVGVYYPGAEVTGVPYWYDLLGAIEYPFWRGYTFFGLTRPGVKEDGCHPLILAEEIKELDPVMVIAKLMDDLRPDERLVYKLLLAGSTTFNTREVNYVLTQSAYEAGERPRRLPYKASFGDDLMNTFSEARRLQRERVARYPASEEKIIRAKISNPLWLGFVFLQMDTPEKERLELLEMMSTPVTWCSWPPFTTIQAMDKPYRQPGVKVTNSKEIEAHDAMVVLGQRLKIVDEARGKRGWFGGGRRVKEAEAWMERIGFMLYPPEIAALWHLPYAGFTARNIVWAGLPVPEELTGAAGERVCLGTAASQGKTFPVYLANGDRSYHLYTTGKTGMGKSTLLHNLIHQDIAAGRGVAVIDPHGKLIDDILAASIPAARRDDMVLLECGRTAYPVPLNPLRIPPGVSEDTAFNYVYWILRRIYEKVWSEGQMDRVLRNVLRTLLLDPEATPLDIQRLLLHGGYRASLLDALQERKMRANLMFWQEYNQKSEGMQVQIAQPILNRTEAFLGNPAVERMTCHPHALNFRALIEGQKVVLINLSGEAVRSEVGSLGAMFLAGFYMAFQALGYLPDNAPPRFYLYVDEVERYVTSPIPDMFSEARKFGLSLALSNQYLDQLSSDTLTGILGNVGTLLAFECGDRDARALASAFAPELDAQGLQNLGAYQVAVKTRFQGRTLPAFTLRTLAPPPRTGDLDPAHLRQRSMEANGLLPASAVDAWLDQRYGGDGTETAADVTAPTDGLSDYEQG